MKTLLYNATLVLPDRLIESGWLVIEDERIVQVGERATRPGLIGLKAVDVAGRFVLPGLIDLHCDAIEKIVEPRPKVSFDLAIALAETDRRLAACGITTEFHAISLDDNEFGTRSFNFINDLAEAIKAGSKDNMVRQEIHARLEVTSARGVPVVQQLIEEKAVRLVSLNDHSPGQGQFKSLEIYRDYVKHTVYKSDEEIDALVEHKRQQSVFKAERIELVSAQAKAAGIALATHDDDDAEQVAYWPTLGVTIAEFPTTHEAAHRAHEVGLAVCMGAPNVVRGKSSGGNLSANATIEAGICDVLCADYYPASMLLAAFGLAHRKTLALPQATCLVTLNPALAVGLGQDFGSLEAGKQADIIVVELDRQDQPRVQRVFVGGRERLTIG